MNRTLIEKTALAVITVFLMSGFVGCSSANARGAGEMDGFAGKGGRFNGGFGGEAAVNYAKDNVSSRNLSDPSYDDPAGLLWTEGYFSADLATGKTYANGSVKSEDFSLKKKDTGYELSSSASEPVKILLSGNYEGTFTLKSAAAPVMLVLDGVTITASDGPALQISTTETVYVASAPGSVNTLTDSEQRSANTKKAALYSKAPLVFCTDKDSAGEGGTLTVNGGYKHGVYSDDYIRITGAKLTVNVSARDCIRTVNAFIMESGELSVNGTGTAVDEESKGIKVEGAESEEFAGEGFVLVNGGTITVKTVSKGITASWKTAEDAETETYADDPNPKVTINGGTISVETTGTPYEKTVNGVEVSCSPEGIEAKSDLVINGGSISIRTADDCINAGISITINGGTIDCRSTQNDAIDANGKMYFNGGTIRATGGTGAECAFDNDFYGFEMNGGDVAGVGGTNLSTPADNSAQNTIICYGSFKSGTEISVKDSSGRVIQSYTPSGAGEAAVLSSPEYKKGETYTITYGTTSVEAKISGTVTTCGNQSGSFGGPGRGGWFGGGRGGFGKPDDMPPMDFENPDQMPEREGRGKFLWW
ncbi:MAG: carbohydrate-binding domain-containing protein [Treponemataceae bacterium]|nr:carbohydrate-binding domain-containing protein [Treponemataceae bacterium]